MTPEERALLEKLDGILGLERVRAQIQPIVERVRAKLAGKQDALMAWEPITLTLFGGALPAVIRSSWVFILRAGANTGAERHPNSHQRMMSFEGTGDMQTEAESVGRILMRPLILYGSRMFWGAIHRRRWSGVGSQFHKTSGTGR
jgi:hypothetical protein